MDILIQIDTIRMGLFIIYFKESQVRILDLHCFYIPYNCFLP